MPSERSINGDVISVGDISDIDISAPSTFGEPQASLSSIQEPDNNGSFDDMAVPLPLIEEDSSILLQQDLSINDCVDPTVSNVLTQADTPVNAPCDQSSSTVSEPRHDHSLMFTPKNYKAKVRQKTSRINKTLEKALPESPPYKNAVKRHLYRKFQKQMKESQPHLTACSQCKQKDHFVENKLIMSLVRMVKFKHRKQIGKLRKEAKAFTNVNISGFCKTFGVPRKFLRDLIKLGSQPLLTQLPSSKKKTEQKDLDALIHFYMREDISNTVPHRKHRNKRFLKMHVNEAYEMYSQERRAAGERVLSLTMFHKHRPKNIKLLIHLPDMGCACNTCVNCSLKLRSLRSNGMEGLSSRLTVNVTETLCQLSTDHEESTDRHIDILEYKLDCIHRQCPSCGTAKFREKLFEENKALVEENKELHYMTWEKVQMEGKERKKICRVKKKETLVMLTNLLLKSLESMSIHLFNFKFQHQEFERCRTNLKVGDVLLVCDFATNFSHSRHEEVQSAHWSRGQTTVHPTVCYFLCTECQSHVVTDEIFIASDDLTHDFHAVATFEGKVEDHLKSNGIEVKRVFRFSDNCATQYKSKHVADWISRKQYPYQSNYFCSQHGKGPSDGVAGRCTQHLALAKKKGTALEVEDAESMVEFFRRSMGTVGRPEASGVCVHKRRHFLVVNDISRDESTDEATTIKGTQKLHCIRNTGVPGVVEVRENSCFCEHCKDGVGLECEQSSHVHKFRRANIYGRNQTQRDCTQITNTMWGDHAVDFTRTWAVLTPRRVQSAVRQRKVVVSRKRTLNKGPARRNRTTVNTTNSVALPSSQHSKPQPASSVNELLQAGTFSPTAPANEATHPVIESLEPSQSSPNPAVNRSLEERSLSQTPLVIESLEPSQSSPNPTVNGSLAESSLSPTPPVIESLEPSSLSPTPLVIESLEPSSLSPAPLVIESLEPCGSSPTPAVNELFEASNFPPTPAANELFEASSLPLTPPVLASLQVSRLSSTHLANGLLEAGKWSNDPSVNGLFEASKSSPNPPVIESLEAPNHPVVESLEAHKSTSPNPPVLESLDAGRFSATPPVSTLLEQHRLSSEGSPNRFPEANSNLAPTAPVKEMPKSNHLSSLASSVIEFNETTTVLNSSLETTFTQEGSITHEYSDDKMDDPVSSTTPENNNNAALSQPKCDFEGLKPITEVLPPHRTEIHSSKTPGYFVPSGLSEPSSFRRRGNRCMEPQNFEHKVNLCDIGRRTQPLRNVALERKVCKPCSVILQRLTSEDISQYQAKSCEYAETSLSMSLWSEEDLLPLSHSAGQSLGKNLSVSMEEDWLEEDNVPLSHFTRSSTVKDCPLTQKTTQSQWSSSSEAGIEQPPASLEIKKAPVESQQMSLCSKNVSMNETTRDSLNDSAIEQLSVSPEIRKAPAESQQMSICSSNVSMNETAKDGLNDCANFEELSATLEKEKASLKSKPSSTVKANVSMNEVTGESSDDCEDSDDDFVMNSASCARTLPCQRGCARTRPLVHFNHREIALPQVDGPSDIPQEQRKLRSSSRRESRPVSVAVMLSPGKDLGLFAAENIDKGTIVCEYEGQLIGPISRSAHPPDIDDCTAGVKSYAFFFRTLDGCWWCIDAENTISYGARINHSRNDFNLVPFVCEKIRGHPRLFFKAARSIRKYEELFYDYGEREEAALACHPWLRL